ncbi:uncharacterized protein IL334_002276 [Kwoniella shivajii]|uniref:FAD-dependent urate hydroxylase HpyO FAD/NAD(P)-binding domain-containing protein n=1 Tax=Kwoniella shivajii TaxID=564305 RepID=A0ABZ1CU99_9TREE|nr:hypothetical protein IL334_002276 [Kwoniella shivajii]
MTIPIPDKPMKRIAVIGAGASGLTQIQQLLEIWQREEVNTDLEVVGFEVKDDVGGVWLTDDSPKKSIISHLPLSSKSPSREIGIQETFSYPPEGSNPSPMYEGLRTNLPHDLMAFRGHPFPKDTPLFPNQELVLKYLQSYAEHYSLKRHIRFSTRVERLHLCAQSDQDGVDSKHSRRWMIESHSLLTGEYKKEQFDNVVVGNGHYSDGWIPPIKGLSSFPGQILHSRFFHKASHYKGKTVLVVGSFASGGDISRLLATENIDKYDSQTGIPQHEQISKEDYIKVYVSSSGNTQYSATDGPWSSYITHLPLISHLSPPKKEKPKGTIHFEASEGNESDQDIQIQERPVKTLDNVDIIIFATGYNFSFPFMRKEDKPWTQTRLSEKEVRKGERENGDIWEEGGIKGQGVDGLDELLLFLKGDRSISFPTLSYQNVPFPLAQVQARLTAFLWADLLPTFPDHPDLPPNPTNPYSQQPPSENGDSTIRVDGNGKDVGIDPPESTSTSTLTRKPRKVLQRIRHLVFGAPYEWTYSEYLMDLFREADNNAGRATEDYWKQIESFRRERREDTGLRKRLLGY